MNHHQTSHSVVSNPKFAWLRQVVLEAVKIQPLDYKFSASEFGDISEDKGIEIPIGHRSTSIREAVERSREIGKIMAALFKDAVDDTIEVEKYKVTKSMV